MHQFIFIFLRLFVQPDHTCMDHFCYPISVRIKSELFYPIVFKDIDECTELLPCSHNCTNTAGGFTCACLSGYELQRDQKSCIGTYFTQSRRNYYRLGGAGLLHVFSDWKSGPLRIRG